ncbi:MAG: DUF1553 domain-containing protein [Akkermansiaceae bacterium]|nr:DUF1553 domain-containing protein [Akkermansiaceae bacterium]
MRTAPPIFLLAILSTTVAAAAPGGDQWIELRGSGARQNPHRRALAKAFDGAELFVRYRLRYDAKSLDTPREGDGEFFVLWLDAAEGGETATHSGGVPNIGVHVKDGAENRFMIRFASGGDRERYGAPLVGGREFTVVARLAKSAGKSDAAYDRLALWIDPDPGSLAAPDAEVSAAGGLSAIRWAGFSTGGKTEPGDRIEVSGLALATRWEAIFEPSVDAGSGLELLPPAKPSPELELTEIPDPPAYVAPPEPETLATPKPPPATIETDHWAFQPLKRPPVPIPRDAAWVRTPIDAFVARRHEADGLAPAPRADDATLTRRFALTVTGLPPGEDAAPADFEAYADALLESTAYGEHWARRWLDVARWAESHGYQHNRDRPNAWKYRDWVVKSLNDDLPYDAFVRKQIAGDEIEPYDPENLIATGFLAAARYSGNELDKTIQRNDILVDVVNTTAKAFLGLTMECAQCHEHFFDPLTQWDYYRMQAFFVQGQPGDIVLEEGAAELIRRRQGLFEAVRARMAENLRARGQPEPVLVSPEGVPKNMTAAEKRKFDELEAAIARFPKTWGYYSPVTSPHPLAVAPSTQRWPLPFQSEAPRSAKARFLDRGDTNSPGPVVTPAWPQVFGPTPELGNRPRLALADWLTDPKRNPLTSRVWVNLIWQGYFGRGLVPSAGDFGTQGDAPTHPELLDWLSTELVESGWSTKHIHRLILRSNTFRQSALFSASNADRDPENLGLWRWRPHRLEAEAIRDSLLAVAGELDPASGGPGIPPAESETSRRRGIYLRQKRDSLPHQQTLFDGANAVTSCARRQVSTVALQPLWLMNSEFARAMAGAFAKRAAAGGGKPPEQAARLISLAYGRKAGAEERDDLAALIRESSLEDAAAVVLNTNEFLYVP